jgi:predicted peptidase
MNEDIMRRNLLLMTLILSWCTVAHRAAAEDNRDRFEARVFVDQNGKRLPYRLLKPRDRQAGRVYPLVLFLHGAGERGDDNRRQLVHGANDFASDRIMDKYPAFVAAPQCPANAQWVDVPWSADAHTMPQQPSEPMKLVIRLLAALEDEFPVDEKRIYVTGLSMGGFGVWDVIQRYPRLFAAAVPICGGGDTAEAEKIAHLPLWVFHGGRDGVVQPRRSRDMVAAVRKAGGKPKYTEYANAAHDSWTATYSNPDFYQWLFTQRQRD